MRSTEQIGTWFKSSFSGASNPNCVEVAPLVGGGAAVRDSKDRSGPSLLFSESAWQAHIDRIKSGEFDRT